MWTTLVALILAWFLAWTIARHFSRPIAALATEASELAKGQFDGSAGRGSSAELDRLADAMEQAAADITKARNAQRDFLANVSHDLRTPLTMIRGYAEMVRDISWRDEAQRENDLGVIIRESERLTGLVNDVIGYSKLDECSLALQSSTFDFSAMARTVVGQFEPICAREGRVINADIASNLTVTGDERQLSRVLYNLIDNAVTHAESAIWISASQGAGAVRVEVRDDGAGIPAQTLPHVWDRYFRTAQTGRNKVGSGLGLAICKQILEAHDCRYGVQSEAGKGSVFWFEI